MTADDLYTGTSTSGSIATEAWQKLNFMSHDDVLSVIDYDKIEDHDTYLEVTQHLGNLKRAGSNNLFGINHRGLKPAVKENKDHYGLTFFTRPQLNLSSSNIRKNRKFYSLLSTDVNSIHRFVRMTLDPRLGMDALAGWRDVAAGANQTKMFTTSAAMKTLHSPLVDPYMGFIPILTNNLLSLSGWPDLALNHYTSEQGLKGQQWIMVDSAYDFLEAFSLSASFRNTADEPIILLFQTWERYMSQVFEGLMAPYMDMIVNNEMDYNTRIYRLVLDESKKFVKKIAACGAAFPVSVPTGKFFDYSNDSLYNTTTKEIDITFQCVGAEYNDAMTIKEFNTVSAIFNPSIKNMLYGLPTASIQIPRGLLHILNNRGYPIIDPSTLELKWYINSWSKDLERILSLINIKDLPSVPKQALEYQSAKSGYNTSPAQVII